MNTLDVNNEIELIIECLHECLDESLNRDNEHTSSDKEITDEQKRFIDNAIKEVARTITGLTTHQISQIIVLHTLSACAVKTVRKEEQELGKLREEINRRRVALNAKIAAYSRHKKSPQSLAKNEIKALWIGWKKHPDKYRSASSFAKDMLDKFPDELSSQQVIQRWVTAWEKEHKHKQKQ